jgi:putative glutamine amidotransferase
MYRQNKPLVAIFADVFTRDDVKRSYHATGTNYVNALLNSTDCTPVILPATADTENYKVILNRFDGVLLTGNLSNVYPEFYNKDKVVEPLDLNRDKTVLPLIEHIFYKKIPLLGICRGFQEVNVALGGSLHADIHDVPGRMDHRAPKSEDPDIQFGKQHEVYLTEDGKLQKLAGSETIEVNSLHTQGIDKLADSLEIEGIAKDETVEAISLKDYKGYFYGVQWHPETSSTTDDFSKKLFSSFNDAVQTFSIEK